MITNANQYHQAVLTHDRRMIDAMIDRIPSRVNRAGKLYKELTDKITNEYHATRKTSSIARTSQTA